MPNLSASVGHAATVGQANATNSDASLADPSLNAGGATVTASFVMARAIATCSGATAAQTGSSQVAALVVNARKVAVSGAPNQTVAVAGGQLIVNKQSTSTGVLTVNALHLVVSGQADVVVAPGGGRHHLWGIHRLPRRRRPHQLW